MKIRILGAHNIESSKTSFASFLIDGVLAVDASALTSNLSFTEQQKLKAVLLTHQHFDHIKDIPSLGMNFLLLEKAIEIYTTKSVYEAITAYLLNDALYPDLTKMPPENPPLHFNIVESGKAVSIAGYSVLPVTVNHSAPSVGYQVTSADGKKVFITSDTGPGLEACWQQISPNLLFIEATVPNKDEKFALQAGHLTPKLLLKELESFRKIKGYLPQVVLVHLNPLIEKSIRAEIHEVEKALNIKIRFSYEGMKLNI
jgi:ribonuclease BN (tRNA processing enzyme)